ncbi:hypothetical protein VTK73DRAFT_5127 [Phialemonium thermophilum]|uniref:Uncharacterized protein n=1 Tax=Phialemonium thermophilum TaxID=223376 RepID=A0ABR3V369_9PEZI
MNALQLIEKWETFLMQLDAEDDETAFYRPPPIQTANKPPGDTASKVEKGTGRIGQGLQLCKGRRVYGPQTGEKSIRGQAGTVISYLVIITSFSCVTAHREEGKKCRPPPLHSSRLSFDDAEVVVHLYIADALIRMSHIQTSLASDRGTATLK